ncbi:magnesium/cobalt transporter CorA [Bacillus tuaregi]|uniref:magnesium/cobalt transporter CorA n=1 Tax=Bacillus tuaregi TaxID=1816695 RepID=UPI0008F8140F|nr:magnesium/cobalt transporter CorA [Bacillus tuaregi]
MIRVVGITFDFELETANTLNHVDFSRYRWYWVDFNGPSHDEISHLTNTFQFHPLAVEDCIHRPQRPKLDYYDNYTFFVTHIVKEKNKEIEREELNFFIGDYYIVTYHREPVLEVNQVWERLMNKKNLEQWDPYYVFYDILDKLVDNYFPLMYKIEDELDKIENNTQNNSMESLMNELFDTRHMLLNLRHSINPMRDLLYRMLNSHHLQGIRDRWEYFSDIYDHLLKLSDMVMSSRELTADIRDSYLSLNSHQTNNVMRILTIITSIFAPLTFIAGIYGMNFKHMPELAWKYGYFLALIMMGAVGVALYFWFKKKGWF